MPIINKTEELKMFLKEVKETGNFQTSVSDITGGLYVQLLKNPYDNFYVRDSNLVYPNENDIKFNSKKLVDNVNNVGSLGKPVIFPNSFSLKSGKFNNGFFNRRNEDLIHLYFCKNSNSNIHQVLESNTYYNCFKNEECYFLVWPLDFIKPINRKKWVNKLEGLWNKKCRDSYCVLSNGTVKNIRESLGLQNRLKTYKRGDWSHLENPINSNAFEDIYNKLSQKLENTTEKIEALLYNINTSPNEEILTRIKNIWDENFID